MILTSPAALLVDYRVADEVMLYIEARADGTIRRLGDVECLRGRTAILCSGNIDTIVFQQLSRVFIRIEHWIGSFTDPAPSGEMCDLIIAIRDVSDVEYVSQWRYGLSSSRPPPEIVDCVTTALALSDSWYANQTLGRSS